MYLFSRTVTAASGQLMHAVGPSVDIAQRVAEVTGTRLDVFRVMYGAPLGTLMWAGRIDGVATVTANEEKLAADDRFLALEQSLAAMLPVPGVDRMARLIVDPGDGPPSAYYAITSATMAAGNYPAAVAHGTRAAQYMGDEFGTRVAFMTPIADGFADVTWAVELTSSEEVDRFNDWLLTDAGYQDIVGEAATLYVESSGHRSLLQKVSP